jgi:hypothetical protein
MASANDKKTLREYDSGLIDEDRPEAGFLVRSVRRTLSLLSMLLILAALGADWVGKAHIRPGSKSFSESYTHLRRSNEYADLGMDELALAEFDQAAKLKEDSHLKWDRASRLAQAGMVLFILALGFFGISWCLGEREFSFWFVVLSIAYTFMFIILI